MKGVKSMVGKKNLALEEAAIKYVERKGCMILFPMLKNIYYHRISDISAISKVIDSSDNDWKIIVIFEDSYNITLSFLNSRDANIVLDYLLSLVEEYSK
jgi:hypothetical protein